MGLVKRGLWPSLSPVLWIETLAKEVFIWEKGQVLSFWQTLKICLQLNTFKRMILASGVFLKRSNKES